MKKIIIAVDNFTQSGERTLAEISAVAQAESGNAAEVLRDPSTGKVIGINVNLPDTASQVAIDAIANNKGVAGGIPPLVFPKVLLNENFDGIAVGALPVLTAAWQYGVSNPTFVGAAADFSVSGAQSLKFAIGATGSGNIVNIIPQGQFATSLQVGRTVETELQFRHDTADADSLQFLFGDIFQKLDLDSGVLKVNKTGITIETGLAVNTFHSLKVRWVVGSDNIDVAVNGVPKGNFLTGFTPGGVAYGFLSVTSKVSGESWIDDLKVTTLS